MNIDVVVNVRPLHGECPIWNEPEGKLYFTDVFGQKIHSLDLSTSALRSWELPARVNGFGFCERGGLIAANWDGIAFLDLETASFDPIWTLPPEKQGRFFVNDARCDRQGRFWAGTVVTAFDAPGAALHRVDAQRQVTSQVDGLVASNGLAFSPDSRMMFYADTRFDLIWAFDYDADDGVATNRRTLASIRRPDGAAVDVDGCYWIASEIDGQILRFAPDGRLDRVIYMPVKHTTMCSFGGPGYDTLFVTSSTRHLTPDELHQQPSAGAVFAITGLGTTGLPEPRYVG